MTARESEQERDAALARIAELERERDAAGGTLYAALRWAGMSAFDLERAASYAKLTIERHEEEERSMRESIRSLTAERDEARAKNAEVEAALPDALALYRETEERLSREVSENAALRALADGMRNAWSVAFDYHCPETLAYDEARRRWAGEKDA